MAKYIINSKKDIDSLPTDIFKKGQYHYNKNYSPWWEDSKTFNWIVTFSVFVVPCDSDEVQQIGLQGVTESESRQSLCDALKSADVLPLILTK